MKKVINFTFVLLILSGCALISNKDRLSDNDIRYINRLGLLDSDESILIFSSSMTKETSGNFVTNKRIASYWIDNDTKRSFRNYAYYDNILKIDSVDLTKAWTYASYLIITRKDSSAFKVYIDGDKEKYHSFIRLAVENLAKHQ